MDWKNRQTYSKTDNTIQQQFKLSWSHFFKTVNSENWGVWYIGLDIRWTIQITINYNSNTINYNPDTIKYNQLPIGTTEFYQELSRTTPDSNNQISSYFLLILSNSKSILVVKSTTILIIHKEDDVIIIKLSDEWVQ